MNDSRYQFLYKIDSNAYKQFDFLHKQVKIFHEETGMVKIGEINNLDDTYFISKGSEIIVGGSRN